MRKENTNIVYFIMLFFFGSILGWLWEMIAFKFTNDGFGWIEIIQNLRGLLHGPWVPIYGFGFILLVLLGQRLKQRPVVLLFSSIVACAFLEYSTSFSWHEKRLNHYGQARLRGYFLATNFASFL